MKITGLLSAACAGSLWIAVATGQDSASVTPTDFSISESEVVGQPVGWWNGAYFIPGIEEAAESASLKRYEPGSERTIKLSLPGAVRIEFQDAFAIGKDTVVIADIWGAGAERAAVVVRLDGADQTIWIRRTNPFSGSPCDISE